MGVLQLTSLLLPSSSVTFLMGLICISIVYWKYFSQDQRIAKHLNKLPGPPALPLIGNLGSFVVPSTKLLHVKHQLIEKYGPVLRLWMLNRPYVVLSSPKDVEVVLSSMDYIEKSKDYFAVKPWLGNALNLVKTTEWRHRRKLLNPAFAFRFLEDFMQVFNEQSVIFKNILDEECVDQGFVNLFPYCCRCTLDVICEATMGTKIEAQTHRDLEYLNATVSASKLIVKRMLRPWLQPDILWNLSQEGREEKKCLKVLHEFTEKVIAERKELALENKKLETKITDVKNNDPINDPSMQSEGKPRLAFLDLLLELSEDGKGLTDLEIRNETDVFMVAGHDTSASVVAWTLFMLALNPEIQSKVQTELDEVFSEDPERSVTTADLAKTKYLELCIKETMRICPPIPIIFRNLNKDLELADGAIVPRGTSITISIVELHRNPAIFPDPLKFDPDRFLPQNSQGRNAYAYIPFAAGPRNCIGMKFAQMEVKVILCTLLREFSFETSESFEDIKISPDIAFRPQNGLHFRIKRRS